MADDSSENDLIEPSPLRGTMDLPGDGAGPPVSHGNNHGPLTITGQTSAMDPAPPSSQGSDLEVSSDRERTSREGSEGSSDRGKQHRRRRRPRQSEGEDDTVAPRVGQHALPRNEDEDMSARGQDESEVTTSDEGSEHASNSFLESDDPDLPFSMDDLGRFRSRQGKTVGKTGPEGPNERRRWLQRDTIYRISLPADQVPEDMYWKANNDEPHGILPEKRKYFLYRVRENGRKTSEIILFRWRREDPSLGSVLFQAPWQLPFFNEISKHQVKYLYGFNPVIAVAGKGVEGRQTVKASSEREEIWLAILRDARVDLLKNETMLLIEWLFTPRQLRYFLEDLQMDTERLEDLQKQLPNLWRTDSTTGPKLIASNFMDLIDQRAVLGPVLPRSKDEKCLKILWFYDAEKEMLIRTQDTPIAPFCMPRLLKVEDDHALSIAMDDDAVVRYQLDFAKYWDEGYLDGWATPRRNLHCTGRSTAVWLAPEVLRYQSDLTTEQQLLEGYRSTLEKAERREKELLATLRMKRRQLLEATGEAPEDGSADSEERDQMTEPEEEEVDDN